MPEIVTSGCKHGISTWREENLKKLKEELIVKYQVINEKNSDSH